MSQKLRRCVQILKNLNQPDRIINRDRINFDKFMKLIGNPFEKFKCIHITGTNGKGSVSIKTAKILQNAGYTVGLYTSPHLFTMRERIQVNGELISQQQISDCIIKIDEISNKSNLPLSYFQYMTAAGFIYFEKRKCDYVALEVGLGGKNDTTNLINPQLSVITSIGLDHTELLGPTRQHIAKQKSGIIKKERPVVLGPLAKGYQSIDIAIKQNNCKVFEVDNQQYDHEDFQSQNNAIVNKVITALKYSDSALNVAQKHVKQGLKVKQPCRMELLQQKYLPKWAKGKKVYFDVGHNSSALQKVRQALMKKGYKKEDVTIVFGTSKGKKFGQSLAQIEKISNHIYLIQAKHFRACKINELQSYIGMSEYPNKYRCISDGNIARTLQYVTVDPHTKIIVIVGSFFIMPEAKGYFDPKVNQFAEQNINQIYQLKQEKQKL